MSSASTKDRSTQTLLEQALIGALIRHPTLFWTHKDRLVPELLARKLHQNVLKILHALAADQRNFSVSTIAAKLPEGDIDAGAYLMTAIRDSIPADEVGDAIEDLEDKLYTKKILDLAQGMTTTATDESMSGRERYAKIRKAFDAIGSNIGASGAKHIAEVASTIVGNASESYQKERVIGSSTNLVCLDNVQGLMFPGRLYGLGGTPGSGKSALIRQIAAALGKNEPGIIFSAEMGAEEFVTRELSALSGIKASLIEQGLLSADDIQALDDWAQTLKNGMVHIDDTPRLNWKGVRDRVIRMKNTKGCGWFMFDHFLLMSKASSRMPDMESHSENLIGLRATCKDLNLKGGLLFQLRTDFAKGTWKDYRKPEMSDAYGAAGLLFQNCDAITLLHREEEFLKQKRPSESAKDYESDLSAYLQRLLKVRGQIEFLNVKLRNGEPFRRSTAYFHGPTMTIHDTNPEDRQAKPVTEPGLLDFPIG